MQDNFINDLIAKLPYVFGSEVDYLRELGRTFTKDTRCLMLGIGPGEMALLLHSAAEDSIPVYREDLDGNKILFEFHAVDYGDVTSYIRHMEVMGFNPGIIHQYLTDDTYHYWYDEYFDVIIVDASHTYDSVKKDIEHYWPKLRYGGIALFHDYVKLESDNGVKEAIEASITDEWQEIARPGISIVYKKVKTNA